MRVSVHLHAVSAARDDWSKLCCAGSTIAEAVCMSSAMWSYRAGGRGGVERVKASLY